jgi:hypothetical protein
MSVLSVTEEGVLDLRGMGGFIPYAAVEELVKKTGKITVTADPEAVRLLRLWAERRGYTVEVRSEDRIVIRRAAPAAPAAAEAPAAPAATAEAVAALTLPVDKSGWDVQLSQKLSEARFIINVVLSAPIVYRGPAGTPEFRAAIGGDGPYLLRVQLAGADYFLVIRGGRVVAGSQLGAPINPDQAENIIKTLFEDSSILVTIYDLSRVKDLS